MILFYPLCSDTAGIQWVALRLLRHGLLPYVGTWEPNFVGTLAFHLPAVLLFGNSDVGFRVIELCFQLGTLGCLFRLSARWLTPRAAFFASYSFVMCSMFGGILYYGQRDVFATGLIVISCELWLRSESHQRWHVLLAGVFLGLAMLIRPFYGLIPLVFATTYWVRLSKAKWILFTGGVGLPTLLSLVPYLITGTLNVYYQTTIRFLLLYASVPAPSYLQFFAGLWRLSPIFLFAAFGALPTGLIPWVRERSSIVLKPFAPIDRRLFVGLLVAVLFIIFAQHRFLGYHFAPLYALIAPLAGAGIERLVCSIQATFPRKIVVIGLPLLLLMVYTPIISVASRAASLQWLHEGYGGSCLTNYDRAWRRMDDSVIAYFGEPRNKKGAVEICSYDARLRCRLEREPASRFLYFQAFTITDVHGGHPDFQMTWRREFLNALVSTPAQFVVLNGYMNFWWRGAPRTSLHTEFPELDSLLRADFTKDTTCGSYDIYRRNSSAPRLARQN